MREYLRKLGRTKFQSFLIITATNIIMLVGYIMNYANVQEIADGWMPAINIGAQLVATVVYQWVEGRIDKAQVESAATIQPSTPTKSSLPWDENAGSH